LGALRATRVTGDMGQIGETEGEGGRKGEKRAQEGDHRKVVSRAKSQSDRTTRNEGPKGN